MHATQIINNMNKRNDIQWLRALAIFAVLGFHIWPKTFPYGYLGVDIFFVISGYLMTTILSKSTNQNLIQFYSRRIKRIFPTCLLMISISTTYGVFYLLPSHFKYLKIEALWSAFFANNFSSMFSKKQYFELVSEFKFFLHTWSLGVEVQFYLTAPFLINFILSKTKPLHWIGLFAIISALLQLLIPFESVSFGLMFCRIWQFLIGTSAFCFFQHANLENLKIVCYLKLYKIRNFTLILLSIICFIPFSLSKLTFIPPTFRLISTFLTGVFILFNELEPISLPAKINRLLIYIGDASYSIYLFHWPIIIYFKYLAIFDIYGPFFTLFCLFIVGILIHEFFEKPLGRASWSINCIFISIFYFIIFYLVIFDHNHWHNNLHPSVHGNEREADSCKSFYYPECKIDPLIEKYLTKRPFENEFDKYCSYQINSKSNKTVLITGNSFVYFQIRGILDAIKKSKQKFNKVYVISHIGCSIIAGELNNKLRKWGCNKNFDGSQDELLKVLRPDVIIHTARLDQYNIFFSNTTIEEEDPGFKAFNKSISNISNYTKRLIIIEPNPLFGNFSHFNPLNVARAIFLNQSLKDFHFPIEEYQRINYPSWNRVKAAVKECKNCAIVSTENILCNSKDCEFVDSETQLAKYCDLAHLSPKASLLLIPEIIIALDDGLVD